MDKIEVIVVDAGNTSVKSSEVVNGELVNSKQWKSLGELATFYPDLPIAISVVNENLDELKKKYTEPRFFILDHVTRLPIKIDYLTPETLGVDRIAVAVGARHLFPKENNLVIDLGTCVTMDLIDDQGIFRGGSISPGLVMRMKAMADYTANLPDISKEWLQVEERTFGKTTKECLFNGSFKGLLHEINGTIETLRADFASLNIIICGGDAHFFDSRIKAHIFAGSKIVEIGIYRIWKHQSSVL